MSDHTEANGSDSLGSPFMADCDQVGGIPTDPPTINFYGADGTRVEFKLNGGLVDVDTHGATMTEAAAAFWEAVSLVFSFMPSQNVRSET